MEMKPKLVLPPRDYIYSVMMARSHELTQHEGKPCDCKDVEDDGKTD